MFLFCADDFLFRRQRVPVLLNVQMSRRESSVNM